MDRNSSTFMFPCFTDYCVIRSNFSEESNEVADLVVEASSIENHAQRERVRKGSPTCRINL